MRENVILSFFFLAWLVSRDTVVSSPIHFCINEAFHSTLFLLERTD